MVRSTVNGILPNVFSYISHFVCSYNFNYTGRPLRGPGIIGIWMGIQPTRRGSREKKLQTDVWKIKKTSSATYREATSFKLMICRLGLGKN